MGSFPGATYLLRYRKVGIPGWTNIQVATNNYTLTGLSELTKYEMQVANICNGIPGTFTPPYYFTTPTVTYCRMSSGSSVGEHISKVTVKPNGKKVMENESGASTYTDYTGVPETFIELIQGSTDNEIIIEKNGQEILIMKELQSGLISTETVSLILMKEYLLHLQIQPVRYQENSMYR